MRTHVAFLTALIAAVVGIWSRTALAEDHDDHHDGKVVISTPLAPAAIGPCG